MSVYCTFRFNFNFHVCSFRSRTGIHSFSQQFLSCGQFFFFLINLFLGLDIEVSHLKTKKNAMNAIDSSFVKTMKSLLNSQDPACSLYIAQWLTVIEPGQSFHSELTCNWLIYNFSYLLTVYIFFTQVDNFHHSQVKVLFVRYAVHDDSIEVTVPSEPWCRGAKTTC